MRLDQIRDRVTSVCAGHPFTLTVSATPFDFDLQPSGNADGVVRIETEGGEPIGGFNYNEERNDLITIWVARLHAATPEATYRRQVTDASSLRAAVIRDAHQDSGEYAVPDVGAGMTMQRDAGKTYSILRVLVPVNYETTV